MSKWTRRRGAGRVGGQVALAYIVVLSVVTVLAAQLAPFGFNDQDYDAILQGPSGAHWLGTDDLGRDVFSRLLHGAQVSLGSAVVAVVVAVGLGVPIGLASGFVGRRLDAVVMRVLDTFLAFPTILLAITITAVLGTGLLTAMVAVGIALMPSFARMMRAQVLVVRERLYVDAARTFGLPGWWMVARHIVPNSIQPVIVLAAHMLGAALLVEASLSFLGLGTPPPRPSWGGMLREASRFLDGLAVQIIAPGLAIAITLLAINVLGDWLRDLLDPRFTARSRRRAATAEPEEATT
jgi:peptide/nickel transport system permease protein